MVRHRIANPFFAGSNPVGHSIECIQMSNKVQIFINKREMSYSRQNMIEAIYDFMPYLTIDDLTTLGNDINSKIEKIRQNIQKSIEECKNIPIQSNRHDT